jgi:hypothetical protein
LGLVRGLPLDPACPNAHAHVAPAQKTSTQQKARDLDIRSLPHELDAKQMLRRLSEQISQDGHDGLEAMDRSGAAGALFKGSLWSHGYTFVGKGTIAALVPHLVHEALLYQHMAHLQGAAIPVHLGNLNLARAFRLASGVEIAHVMFLSYGGEEAWRVKELDRAQLCRQVDRSVAEVRRAGVKHNDLLNKQNVLWNAETQRAMIIDFEDADATDNEATESRPASPAAAANAITTEPEAKRARVALGNASTSIANRMPRQRDKTKMPGRKQQGKALAAAFDRQNKNMVY